MSTNAFFLFLVFRASLTLFGNTWFVFPRICMLMLFHGFGLKENIESYGLLAFPSILSHQEKIESLLQSSPWPKERRSVPQWAQHVNKEPRASLGNKQIPGLCTWHQNTIQNDSISSSERAFLSKPEMFHRIWQSITAAWIRLKVVLKWQSQSANNELGQAKFTLQSDSISPGPGRYFD